MDDFCYMAIQSGDWTCPEGPPRRADPPEPVRRLLKITT